MYQEANPISSPTTTELQGVVGKIRDTNGNLTDILEELQAIADRVLGHEPTSGSQEQSPSPVPNGLLSEIRMALENSDIIVAAINGVKNRLRAL